MIAPAGVILKRLLLEKPGTNTLSLESMASRNGKSRAFVPSPVAVMISVGVHPLAPGVSLTTLSETGPVT